ncbi:MAG TPA: hypothetical protein G4O16_10960 [Dehalococcoidia bacterium]|nr:hypothetical protein [Dehalococcoidia bacterium]
MKRSRVFSRGSFLYPLASVLLILTLLLLFSACNTNNSTTPTNSSTSSTTNPPGNILEFEDYPIDFGMEYINVPTHIYVMSSINSPLPNEVLYVSPETQADLNSFEFPRYFILFAFMGSQTLTGPSIKVTQIWQIDNTIYIEAFFDKGGPTYQPAYSLPCDIVKVSKENMTQFGEITFILLDQFGEERASAVYNIN